MQSKWNKYKISLIFIDTLVCIFKYGFLWKVLHRRRFKKLWNVPQRRLKKGIVNENNCQKYVRWKQQENQFQGTMSYEWKEDASLPTGWKLKNGVNCTYFLRWCQLISCPQSSLAGISIVLCFHFISNVYSPVQRGKNSLMRDVPHCNTWSRYISLIIHLHCECNFLAI